VEPECTVEGTKLNKDTGQCEAEEGPKCPDDLKVVGEFCVSVTKKPECPDKTVPFGERCVARTKPVCGRMGSGLDFDPSSGLCLGGSPKCPDRTELDKGMGKCVTASLRTCFALLSCPDVVDDTAGVPAIE